MSESFNAAHGTEFRGPDSNGHIWIITPDGTAVVPESDLVEYAADMLDTAAVRPEEMRAMRTREVLNLSLSLLETMEELQPTEAVEEAAKMLRRAAELGGSLAEVLPK